MIGTARNAGLALMGRGDAARAVLGLQDLIADAAQQIAQDLPVILLVFHHQNPLAHGARAHRCAGAAR